MKPEDIKDEASLKAWLETQTREVAVTIAYRAAMRVAPVYWVAVKPISGINDQDALPVVRCSVLTAVSLVDLALVGPRLNRAARKAHAAAKCVDFAAAIACRSSARFLNAVSPTQMLVDAAQSINEAARALVSNAAATNVFGDSGKSAANAIEVGLMRIRKDAAAFAGNQAGQAAFQRPLWPRGKNELSREWAAVRRSWAATKDPGWQFWVDWYDAALHGRPLLGDWDRHWALLTDIALIDPKIWDAGPDEVNPKVAEIVAEHKAQSVGDQTATAISEAVSPEQLDQLEAFTEYGEIIAPNPETGLLRSEPKSELDDYHRDDVLDRLDDALANIDREGGQNFAYAIILRDMDRLKRVLKMRRDRPVRVFQVTLEVVHLIERRAKNGECPMIEADPDLSTLVRELYGAAATLLAHDPVVKRFNNPVLHQRVNEITDEQARSLGTVLAKVPSISEDMLKNEAAEDSDHLAKGESDPEVRRNLLIRTISRIVRVYGIAVRSNTVQTVNLAAAIYTLEPIFLPTIKWLMFLLL